MVLMCIILIILLCITNYDPLFIHCSYYNFKTYNMTDYNRDYAFKFYYASLSLVCFAQTTIHTANRMMADKYNIPKGKIHSNCRLLPNHIVCKITQRNNIRRANTCDPALKLLNKEITSGIQKHKQDLWKDHTK